MNRKCDLLDKCKLVFVYLSYFFVFHVHNREREHDVPCEKERRNRERDEEGLKENVEAKSVHASKGGKTNTVKWRNC